MRRLGWLIAGVVLLVSLGGFLANRAVQFDQREHEGFQTALWQIRQLDASFKQELLQSRLSLLTTYDDFVANHGGQLAALETLRRVPSFVAPQAAAELEHAAADYGRLLAKSRQLTERFKSQNAVVANSRSYLPVAMQQLLLRTGATPREIELDRLVDALARAVLGHLSGGGNSTDMAQVRVAQLVRWADQSGGHALAADARNLARHAQVLIDGSIALEALTRQLQQLPTAELLEALQNRYQVEVAGDLQRAHLYRLWLYAAAALFVVGVAYLLLTQLSLNHRLEQRVAVRTAEVAASERRLWTLADAAPSGIVLTDAAGGVLYSNPHFQGLLGLSAEQIRGDGWTRALHPEDRQVFQEWAGAAASSRPYERECRWIAADGRVLLIHGRTAVVRSGSGEVTGHVVVLQDVTERARLAAEQQQSQKLESVGRLAAGVAHEINTPVQFVNDSCHFLRDGMADLQTALGEYRQTLAQLGAGALSPQEAQARLAQIDEQADLAYLMEHMPAAIQCALDGLQRVAAIVRSMKEFAYPDQRQMTLSDLNRAIQSTLTVARNEYKYVAELETEFADLPLVPCFLGDLNQAVLNLVVNAAHAIEDHNRGSDRIGRIRVTTALVGERVRISVEDNGGGVPEAIRDKIFDPFFTTKVVGRGTGQGLAITRSVVVDKHGGSLRLDSQPGQGSTFVIELPIQQPESTPALKAAA